MPISGPILQPKANANEQLLGKDFQRTESWIYRFCKRNSIVLGKISGDTNSVHQSNAMMMLG